MRKISAFFVLALIFGSVGFQIGNAQESHQVGLVVQFLDGSLETRCIEFQESDISGFDVLQRSGLEIVADFNSSIGAAICKIEQDGCSAENCFCDMPNYWSYWHQAKNSENEPVWVYSQQGASNTSLYGGEVEGWRYGAGLPPEELPALDEICAPLTPTSTNTSISSTRTPTATPTRTSPPPPPPPPMPTSPPIWVTAALTPIAEETNTPPESYPTAGPATYTPTASPTAVLPTADSIATQTALEQSKTLTAHAMLVATSTVLVTPTEKVKKTPGLKKTRSPTTATEISQAGPQKGQGGSPVTTDYPKTAELIAAEQEQDETKRAPIMMMIAGGLLGYIVFLTMLGFLGLTLAVLWYRNRRR